MPVQGSARFWFPIDMLATDMRSAFLLSFSSLLLVSISSLRAQDKPTRDLEAEIDSLKQQIEELRTQQEADRIDAARDSNLVSSDAQAKDQHLDVQDARVFSSVDLEIWGRVVFNMTADNFEGKPFLDFQNYVVAEGPSTFNFNPRDSRLGFGARQDWDDWTAGAVIEIDFYGANAGNNIIPRMRLGYAHVANKKAGFSLRAGQDWTPVAAQNPGTIDFGILAWAGNLWWRVPQLTLRQGIGRHLELLLSVMKHRIANSMEAEERMPWVLERLCYKGLLPNEKGLLALSLGGRQVKVQGHEMNAWLLALEWNLPFHPLFAIRGEVWAGEGIGDEFLRYGLAYNLATGRSIHSRGGFFSIQSQVSDHLFFNIGLGIDDPDSSQTGPENSFNRNQIAFANAQYKFTKHFGMGLEIMDLQTQTTTNKNLRGQRFTISTWFVF